MSTFCTQIICAWPSVFRVQSYISNHDLSKKKRSVAAPPERSYVLDSVVGIAHRILHAANGIFDLSLGLIHLAFGLQLRIAGYFPRGVLEATLCLIAHSLHAVLI